MQKPFWRVNIEHARYGLTDFRIQSIICFVIILNLGFLLRLSTIVWGVSSRCVEADQFWFEPYKSDWPIGGIFFFVLFLMLAWNASIFLNYVVRQKREYFLPTVNFIAIIALLMISAPGYKSSQISYDDRDSTYGDWRASNRPQWPFYIFDKCFSARDYVGNWAVVEKNLESAGVKFPFVRIHLRQSLTYQAAVLGSDVPYENDWYPPRPDYRLAEKYRDVGTIYMDGKHRWQDWHFQLDGDTLTLTSFEQYDWIKPSKVILERSRAAK